MDIQTDSHSIPHPEYVLHTIVKQKSKYKINNNNNTAYCTIQKAWLAFKNEAETDMGKQKKKRF